METEVVGWNWAQNPGKLQKGLQVSLELEPENIYDRNAVKVFLADSRLYVGRIPATNSAEVAALLRSHARICAEAISRSSIKILIYQ